MNPAQKRLAKAAAIDAARHPQRPDFAALDLGATRIAEAGVGRPVDESALFASLRLVAS